MGQQGPDDRGAPPRRRLGPPGQTGSAQATCSETLLQIPESGPWWEALSRGARCPRDRLKT